MIKAIIFDFAGVIESDGYWSWLCKKIPNLAKNEVDQADFQYLSDEVDSGEISNETYIQKLAKLTKTDPKSIWPEIFQNLIINRDLLKIIRSLKQKYKLGLLSNYTHEWLEEILTRHKLRAYFDQIVISSLLKIRKPHSSIFIKMLDLLQVSPQEAIFIDDRQVHVDGANNVGIKGVLFTTNNKLRQDLLDIGVTT